MSIDFKGRGLAALMLLAVGLLQACSAKSGPPAMTPLQATATAAAIAGMKATLNAPQQVAPPKPSAGVAQPPKPLASASQNQQPAVVPATGGQVTNAQVSFSFPLNEICGDPGNSDPLSFSGVMSTDGPATVTFQYEVTGGPGTPVTSKPLTMTFDDGGTNTTPQDQFNQKLDCGSFKVAMHVLSPNDFFSESVSFDIVAGP